MQNDERRERFRFNILRLPSTRTTVLVERRAREVHAAWLELRVERKALERASASGWTLLHEAWIRLLSEVPCGDEVIRVRHRYHDGPAILMSESRFRALEKAAGLSPVDQ